MQAVLAHQMGADAGQIALVGAGEAFVQQAGHGQAQHGIAEELEPLVVVGAEAAVRQRAGQQFGLAEAVTEALLEGSDLGAHGITTISWTGPRT